MCFSKFNNPYRACIDLSLYQTKFTYSVKLLLPGKIWLTLSKQENDDVLMKRHKNIVLSL